MKTRVSLKYFVTDCSWGRKGRSLLLKIIIFVKFARWLSPALQNSLLLFIGFTILFRPHYQEAFQSNMFPCLNIFSYEKSKAKLKLKLETQLNSTELKVIWQGESYLHNSCFSRSWCPINANKKQKTKIK